MLSKIWKFLFVLNGIVLKCPKANIFTSLLSIAMFVAVFPNVNFEVRKIICTCGGNFCWVSWLTWSAHVIIYHNLYFSRCQPGFQGAHCENECSPGFFGPQCKGKCQCLNNATCDKKDGTCDCLPGWIGVRCDNPCPAGYYGKNCQSKCGCQNGGSCDSVDGKCTCVNEWQGESCDICKWQTCDSLAALVYQDYQS